VSAPVLAENVAELDPAGTRTEAGTVNTPGAVFARRTVAPVPEAALESVTVQVVEALAARLVATHCSPETVRGETSEIVVDKDDPAIDAVTVAVRSLVRTPAFAGNVADAEPAGMVTEGASVRLLVSEPRFAVIPPVPAGPFNVTVQVLEVEEVNELGLQERLVIAGAIATAPEPPVAETVTASPASDAANPFVTAIATDDAVGASSTETVATGPLGMVFAFIPTARQVYAVASPAQLTDLPAESDALPVATVKPATASAG
jgi:hypothetical protein